MIGKEARNFPQLEELGLENIGISDGGFSTILAYVMSVSVANCSLRIVNLRQNARITMDRHARNIATEGLRAFNKSCYIAH